MTLKDHPGVLITEGPLIIGDYGRAHLRRPTSERVIHRFDPQTIEKPWGTETLVAHTAAYTGKLLRYRAGAAGPLQYHVHKDETMYLYSGQALVTGIRYGDGALSEIFLSPGESLHVPRGTVHRFRAITDCVVFEASTPHFEDRVNVEDPLSP